MDYMLQKIGYDNPYFQRLAKY